jgi:hypothetical protein
MSPRRPYVESVVDAGGHVFGEEEFLEQGTPDAHTALDKSLHELGDRSRPVVEASSESAGLEE